MTRKSFGLLSVLIVLVGCASTSVRSDWKQKRGYSDEHFKEFSSHSDTYMRMIARGGVAGNAFNSTEKVAAEGRVRNIFCACVKKLGDRCRQNPDGLAPADRELWAKSNGAEMALMGMARADNPFDSNAGVVDTAECQ